MHTTKLDVDEDISLLEIAAILRRRKFVILVSVISCIAAALAVTLVLPQKRTAEAQMILLQESNDGKRWMSTPLLTSLHLGETMIESPDTQVALIQSPEMARRTLRELRELREGSPARGRALPADINMTPDELSRHIKVVNPKNTNLLMLSVTTPQPDASVAIADALCRAFIDWKRDLAQARAEEMIQKLSGRTQRARADLLGKERRLTEFMRQSSVLEIDAQNRALLGQLTARDNEVSALEQEWSAAQVRAARLQEQVEQTNALIRQGGAVRDDEQVTRLQSQIQQLEMERADAGRKYTDAYPGVLPELDGKIKETKKKLAHALQGSVDGTRPSLGTQKSMQDALRDVRLEAATTARRLQMAKAQQERLRTLTALQPAKTSVYGRLSGDAALARSLYTELAERLNSALAGRDMITSNIRVSQPATLPDDTKLSRLGINLILGVVVGLFASAIAALLLEQSDRRVRSAEEAARLVSGTVIGTIPQFSRREMQTLSDSSSGSYSTDTFGLASANLSLLWNNDQARPRIVLVTSALPGEGKSTVAAEIARAMARTASSVILVDADLRRPTQMNNFQSGERKPGLADVLAGRASVEDALVASEIPGLSVLHSGGPVTDATALITSSRLADVLKTLSEEAVTVVVDTPACAIVPDALLLAPHADFIVQVIGVGRVDVESVRTTTAALHAAAPRQLVYLVNRVLPDRARARSYRATYGRRTAPSRALSGQS